MITVLKRSAVSKAIEKMTVWLTGSITWVEKAPDQRESFCIDFITSFLDNIQITDTSFDWLSQCSEYDAIYHILKVYENFMARANCQSVVEQLPHCIQSNPSPSVEKLFKWIIGVQKFLQSWSDRFTSQSLNYDQIMLYKQNVNEMLKLSTYFNVEHLVHSELVVKATKLEFEKTFKELNSLLLKPVPIDGQEKT